jgi:hypothetical protein
MNRKRSRVNRLNQASSKNLQQKIDMTTTTTSTSAPDYLPYNEYKNLETMQEKPQEDIHSQISALQPKQQQTQRKRHSKPIKISGDVDLGMTFSQKNQRKRQRKHKTTENPQQHHTSSNNNNNHHHHPNNALPEPDVVEKIVEQEEEETTAPRVVEETSLVFSSTSTDAPAPQFEQSTMSEMKKKLEEKALRRERLKAKLAQLTPEERQAFLLMKQQRADARKKGLNFAKTS